MSLYENVSKDFVFEDHRGSLVQLVHDGFAQINVLKTGKSVTRGGHYHKIARERFYVVNGTVSVRLSKDNLTETVIFKEGDFFEIMPFVAHEMFFPEDCTMVAMYDIPVEHEDGSKDIYPVEVLA